MLKHALMRTTPCSLRRMSKIRSMSDDADKWTKTYHLTAQGAKNKCTSHTEDGHRIQSDIPRAMGGNNSAPQPVYLLLSAMVGCETSTAYFVARKMGIKIEDMHFDLHARRDQRGVFDNLPSSAEASSSEGHIDDMYIPSMLQEIRGEVVIRSSSATQAQVDALAREVKKRCPVASMIFKSGCHLSVQWKLEESTLNHPQIAK